MMVLKIEFILKKIFWHLLLLLCASSVVAQNSAEERADELLKKARIAVYGEIYPQIESAMLVTSGETYIKTFVEIKGMVTKDLSTVQRQKLRISSFVLRPGFARADIHMETINAVLGHNIKSTVIMVVNGDRLSQTTSAFLNGQKVDVGKNNPLRGMAKKMKMGGDPVKTIPAHSYYNAAWLEFAPFLLRFGGEAQVRLKYVGKAESEGRIANVLEMIQSKKSAQNKKISTTTRYFFDAATNLLLMSTTDSKSDAFEKKTTVFYSDFKEFGGLLIPSKIKTESNLLSKLKIQVFGLTMIGQKQHTITDIIVEKFEINPEFPAGTFEIKGKKKN